jgi:hypothetical protein
MFHGWSHQRAIVARGCSLVLVVLMLGAAVSFAADPASPGVNGATNSQAKKDTAGHDALLAELTSGDASRVAEAVKTVKAKAIQHYQDRVGEVQILYDAKLYAEANTTALELPQMPLDWCNMLAFAPLQKLRVQSLLAAGKPTDALSAAKVYYSIVPLNRTAEAINLVTLCLVSARPDDPGIARRFKRQQVVGASVQPSTQSAEDLGAPVLAGITVDPKPFEAAIAQITLGQYSDFEAKGNLLLASGKAKEARQVFQQADALVPEGKEARSIENLARAIRADAGCVGPANAYILQRRQEAGDP